jgi:DNA-directed RNA polymerase subunit M/transcription elongation factor TFIIS
MKFCPTCRYYLYLSEVDSPANDGTNALMRVCRTCGYQEMDEGGLVLETDLKEKTSEAYKILMNEFTKSDPTLPRLDTIKCPKPECSTNTSGTKKNVTYLKYDAINLKFLYICNVCDTHWRSKTAS